MHAALMPACSRIRAQNLFVADLPGEHAMHVDGAEPGKGQKARPACARVASCIFRLWRAHRRPHPAVRSQVRLKPGMRVDLAGKGGDLAFEVFRDEHAHA